MAISFMVLGGPRSATTWMANWLNTDDVLCLHDPLSQYPIEKLPNVIFEGKRFGVSCTSLLLYPDFVERQNCPKVILFRDVNEINESLKALGLPNLQAQKHYDRIAYLAEKKKTLLVPYDYVIRNYQGAKRIAAHLGVPFCSQRWTILTQMNVQVAWKTLPVDKEAVTSLVKRIKETLEA